MNLRLSMLAERARAVRAVARFHPFDTSTPEGRSSERYRRIVLGTAATIVGRAVVTVAGLLTVPLAIGYLGKERYGLWAAVLSLATWVSLFDLGLVNGLFNPIAEAHGRDDGPAAAGYFATAFSVLACVAGVLALGLVVLAPAVPWERVVSLPAGMQAGDLNASVTVALGLAIVALPLATTGQVFAGYQSTYVATAFSTVGALLSLALLLGAIRMQGPLQAVVGATSSGAALGGLLCLAYLVSRKLPWIRQGLARVSGRSLRRLLVTAAPLYLFQIGALLINQTQAVVLARRAGLSTVADYDPLWRAYVVVVGLVTVGTASFLPSLREAFERRELEWTLRTFRRMSSIRLSIAAPIAVLLIPVGNSMLRLWLRRTDIQFPPSVWLTLSALLVVAVWTTSYVELMTVLDRIWPLVGLVLFQGAVTVGLTWILGAGLGVLGALLGLLCPALLSALLLPGMAHRMLRPSTHAEAQERHQG